MNYRLGIALISVILMGGAGTVRSTEDQEGSSGIRDESQPVKGHENMADLHAYMLDRLLAQSDDSDSGGDTFRRMHQMRGRQGMGPDADRRKYLEQFRTLKLLELLNLKEDQEIEFLTAFRNIRKQGQSFEQEKRQLLESAQARKSFRRSATPTIRAPPPKVTRDEGSGRGWVVGFVTKLSLPSRSRSVSGIPRMTFESCSILG